MGIRKVETVCFENGTPTKLGRNRALAGSIMLSVLLFFTGCGGGVELLETSDLLSKSSSVRRDKVAALLIASDSLGCRECCERVGSFLKCEFHELPSGTQRGDLLVEKFSSTLAQLITDRIPPEMGAVHPAQDLPVEGWALKPSVMYNTKPFGHRATIVTYLYRNRALVDSVMVEEERIVAGHLGWALPVTLLTFPIGIAIPLSVMPAITHGAKEDAVGMAMESTAEKVAEKMKVYYSGNTY